MIGAKMFNLRDSDKLDNLKNQLKSIAGETGVWFVDIEQLYCDFKQKLCDVFTDEGYLIVRDYGHLTTFGARYLGRNLDINLFQGAFKLDSDMN